MLDSHSMHIILQQHAIHKAAHAPVDTFPNRF
jgi:hypothetical protein